MPERGHWDKAKSNKCMNSCLKADSKTMLKMTKFLKKIIDDLPADLM